MDVRRGIAAAARAGDNPPSGETPGLLRPPPLDAPTAAWRERTCVHSSTCLWLFHRPFVDLVSQIRFADQIPPHLTPLDTNYYRDVRTPQSRNPRCWTAPPSSVRPDENATPTCNVLVVAQTSASGVHSTGVGYSDGLHRRNHDGVASSQAGWRVGGLLRRPEAKSVRSRDLEAASPVFSAVPSWSLSPCPFFPGRRL